MNYKVVFIIFLTILSGMGYSLLVPIFPELAHKFGINEKIFGIIVSLFSLSIFLTSPFVSYLSLKFGRKKLLLFSTFMEAISTFCYGILYYVSSYILNVSLTFLLRIVHGVTTSISLTLIYSITPALAEKEYVKKAIGYLELGYEIGEMLGPFIGGILFTFGGYTFTFIICGIVMLISVLIVYKLDLGKMDNTIGEEDDEHVPSLSGIFLSKEGLINFIQILAVSCVSVFYDPSLTNHLMNTYNFSVGTCSFFFIIPSIFYLISLQIIDLIYKYFSLYGSILFGLIFTVIGLWFIYPIKLLHKSFITTIIGFALTSIGSGPVLINELLLAQKLIKDIFGDSISNGTINDMSSSYYIIGYNMGCVIGPWVDGYISDKYGFYYSCLYISYICLFLAILFFIYYFKKIIGKIDDLPKIDEELEEGFLLNLSAESNSNNNSVNSSFYVLPKRKSIGEYI